MAGGERVHAAKVLSAPVAARWSQMINGWTWPNPHLALTASGDKSGALVRDGVCSALQGQGLTPTETQEQDGLNIHSRQADRAPGSELWKCKRCVKTQLCSRVQRGVYTVVTCRGVPTASIYGVAHHGAVRETLTWVSSCHSYLSGTLISMTSWWLNALVKTPFCRSTLQHCSWLVMDLTLTLLSYFSTKLALNASCCGYIESWHFFTLQLLLWQMCG